MSIKYENNIVQFTRNASFIKERANKNRKDKNPIEVLELMRQAFDIEPDNIETKLQVALLLAQIGWNEESNRLIFQIRSVDKSKHECLYHLGNNFYALNLYECARECWMAYLRNAPLGVFQDSCEELLADLDENLGLNNNTVKDGIIKGATSIKEVKSIRNENKAQEELQEAALLLDGAKFKAAKRHVEKALKYQPIFPQARAMLAFTLLKHGDIEGALINVIASLSGDPDNVQALCVRGLIQLENGEEAAANHSFLHAANSCVVAEDRLFVAQMISPLSAHEVMLKLLRELSMEMPYNKQVLHMLAAAMINNNLPLEQASVNWSKILRIDPTDLIAGCYLSYAKHGYIVPGHVTYEYQVPIYETVAHFDLINKMNKLPPDEMMEAWDSKWNMYYIAWWVLDLPSEELKLAMLDMLYDLKTPKAIGILKDFLTKPFESDSAKDYAIKKLVDLGEEGPFDVINDLHMKRIFPEAVFIGKVSRAADTMLEELAQKLWRKHGDGAIKVLFSTWATIMKLRGAKGLKTKRIAVIKVVLEYMCYINMNVKVDAAVMAKNNNISLRSFKHYYRLASGVALEDKNEMH